MTTPTNEPKTAEEIAMSFCVASKSHGVLLIEPSAGGGCFTCQRIAQKIKSYAQQEGRELVEALESVLGVADRKTVEFDTARKAVSAWEARNQ